MSRHESKQIEEASSSTQIDEVAGCGNSKSMRDKERDASMAWRARPRNSWRNGEAAAGLVRGGGRVPGEFRGCRRCGKEFCDGKQRCIAKQAECYSCKGRGHFARMCKKVTKRVHNLSVSSEESNSDIIYINMINCSKRCEESREWFDNLYCNALDVPVDRERNHRAMLKQQEKQKYNYDKTTKCLPVLHNNDKVVMVDGKQRKLVKVLHQAVEPRSYIVEDEAGRKYRRNRRHLVRRRAQAKHDIIQSGDTALTSDKASVVGKGEPFKEGCTSKLISEQNSDSKHARSSPPKNIYGPITRRQAKLLLKNENNMY
ncbi:unnamed protein product, partial [Brenthis ino]